MVRIGIVIPVVGVALALASPVDTAFAQVADRAVGVDRAATAPSKGMESLRATSAERSAGGRERDRFAGGRDVTPRVMRSSASAGGRDRAKTSRKTRDRDCRRSLYPPERWQDGQPTYNTRCDYRPYR